MRIRRGFVSNSSTSSFMIAAKGELTPEMIMGWLNTGKDSVFYSFAKQVAKYMVHDHDYVVRDLADLRDFWRYNWGEEYEEEEEYQKHVRLIGEGWTLYFGSASNESYEIESQWLVDATIDYNTYNLIIQKEGGF